jgi:hypothetical protein
VCQGETGILNTEEREEEQTGLAQQTGLPRSIAPSAVIRIELIREMALGRDHGPATCRADVERCDAVAADLAARKRGPKPTARYIRNLSNLLLMVLDRRDETGASTLSHEVIAAAMGWAWTSAKQKRISRLIASITYDPYDHPDRPVLRVVQGRRMISATADLSYPSVYVARDVLTGQPRTPRPPRSQ